jgi:hypothetical protein
VRPAETPVTAKSMDCSVVVTGRVLILSRIWYFVRGRRGVSRSYSRGCLVLSGDRRLLWHEIEKEGVGGHPSYRDAIYQCS